MADIMMQRLTNQSPSIKAMLPQNIYVKMHFLRRIYHLSLGKPAQYSSYRQNFKWFTCILFHTALGWHYTHTERIHWL